MAVIALILGIIFIYTGVKNLKSYTSQAAATETVQVSPVRNIRFVISDVETHIHNPITVCNGCGSNKAIGHTCSYCKQY